MKELETHKTCPHCHKEFEGINGRVFSNHVRWCDMNPERNRLSGSGFSSKMATISNDMANKRLGKFKQFEVVCSKCGKSFSVVEREKLFPSKEKYFCSRSCANSRVKVKQKKQKKTKPKPETEIRHCLYCNEEFEAVKATGRKFCCGSCAAKHREDSRFKEKLAECKNDRQRLRLELIKYRQLASFKFAINKFPEEFDLDLIRTYGWYKAKNRGDNIEGVSRDHCYSIVDGFKNGIPPEVIAHPANCRLVRQSENASKGSNSSISIEDLYEKIRKWNEKYSNKNS